MRKLLAFVFILMMPGSVWAWTTINHFDSLSTADGWYDWAGAGVPSITGSEYAPTSPNNSLQIMSPEGMPDSSSTAGASFTFPSQTKEFWMQYYFKYSSNFQFHTVGNKQIYTWYGDGSMGGVIFSHCFEDPHMWAIFLNSEGWLTYNTGNNITINRNQWYKVVFHIKMVSAGNDVFQMWIDDQLVMDYNKITTTNNYEIGFLKVSIDPVWGGAVTPPVPKSVTDYQWYDYAIVSTEPLVAGGGKTGKIPSSPNKLLIQ